MRWAIVILTFMASNAAAYDEINIKDSRIPDILGNRVCAPHFRNYEVLTNQWLKLNRALKENEGKDKESFMYKAELMNAIKIINDSRKEAHKLINECIKQID